MADVSTHACCFRIALDYPIGEHCANCELAANLLLSDPVIDLNDFIECVRSSVRLSKTVGGAGHLAIHHWRTPKLPLTLLGGIFYIAKEIDQEPPNRVRRVPVTKIVVMRRR